MTNTPAPENADGRSVLITATWHIYSPMDLRKTSLRVGSSVNGPKRKCVLGPEACIEIVTLPYPIPGHHFLSYVLSLMSNSIDAVEIEPEKVRYFEGGTEVPDNLTTAYFPAVPPPR